MKTSLTIDMPEVALVDKLKLNWRDIKISQEVMDMTFQNRVDLGTVNYKDLLEQALMEKYS